MTKAFSVFGRRGLKIVPILIRKVEDHNDELIVENISLDNKFKELLETFNEEFRKTWEFYWDNKNNNRKISKNNEAEDPEQKEKSSSIFFKNLNQIISPKTAYLVTSLLQGVIFDPAGTGKRAQVLNRPVAGKTGSTNGYYDAWFIGYSPQISTGVWVGFDNEESLGQSETGSRAALPIWIEFMKKSHESLKPIEFPVPESIVFANIDNETGYLAGASTKEVVKQAFVEGTEPKEQKTLIREDEDQHFLREDLSF